MLKLYGIPNCDTVKKAQTWLSDQGFTFEFINFKKTPPDASDIERWKKAFGGLPVNAKGTTYKKHADVYLKLTEKQQVKFLTENSSMIKRPILEKSGKVIAFGFSMDDYKKELL